MRRNAKSLIYVPQRLEELLGLSPSWSQPENIALQQLSHKSSEVLFGCKELFYIARQFPLVLCQLIYHQQEWAMDARSYTKSITHWIYISNFCFC